MIFNLLAVTAGMLGVGGIIMTIAGFVGTTKPVPPPSRSAVALRRWWRGDGRSVAAQRARQVLMIASVVGGALTWLISGVPIAGLIVALAIPGIPWLFSAGGAEKRAIARLEAVETWTRRLGDVVANGIGLQAAIVSTANMPPALIEREVRELAARMQARVDPVVALRHFADDIDDYSCDQVIAPLILHVRDRGEGLGQVLADISTSIAAEIDMRSTVDAKRASPRFAVRFLTGMTIVLIVIGLLNADYLEPYQTFVGQMLLLFLAAFYTGLMVWVRTLSVPKREARLLESADAAVAR
jgi:hypothetical protein